jgi:4-amino-4-deoxy-L-arabinose transferase
MTDAAPGAGSRHWRRSGALLALLLYACALQGVRPLYSPDEGRYTDVALMMLADGDWLHPMLHPEVPHWSKPPLTYWSIGASLAVFGHAEWAARLPGALAFAGTVLLLLRLGRRFVPTQPWLAGLVYATFALPPLAANLVTTDTLLALFETLQVVAFVDLWWATDPGRARRAGLLLGLAAGLAFLTKGPPGLLALAACLAFAGWEDGLRGLRRVAGWRTLLVFVLVGGSWYALIAVQEPGVLRYFLVEEVVNRVASDRMHRNAQWYGAITVYLPTLLLGTLPWLPLVLASAWRGRRQARARLRGDAGLRLLVCWLLLPLAVFVLARSRLPLYLLPLFAPLALLVACSVAPLAPARWQVALLVAWSLLLVGARALPALLDVAADDRALAKAISALLPSAPDEVAFVATAPRFGLRFYLGSEVERIDLPDAGPTAQAQDLSGELQEHEGCRLFAVPPYSRAALAAALAGLGVDAQALGEARGYALLAEFSDDCAWRRAAGGMLAR